MFRAHRAHHQERQTVPIQPLVAVGGRVVCTRHGHKHRVTVTSYSPKGTVTNSYGIRGYISVSSALNFTYFVN